MDRYDYIEAIIQELKGSTGNNFQNSVGIVLKKYFKSINKTYEMPNPYGGDDKNDGWVKEDALFYQIYAPLYFKDSFAKNIRDKFKTDLTVLLKLVYDKDKWGGSVKEFIFITNTVDNNLPKDSDNFYQNTVNSLKEQYKLEELNYRVENIDYIREDILEKIQDKQLLKNISSALHIKNYIDYNAITEKMVYNLIIEISGNISKQYINNYKKDSYTRISTFKKIEINDLTSRQEEIENCIRKLDVVESAINLINQDITCENKFERVKDYIVHIYEELSPNFHGEQLYDKILETLYEKIDNSFCVPINLLVVYIFDKCDIFEKEKVQ